MDAQTQRILKALIGILEQDIFVQRLCAVPVAELHLSHRLALRRINTHFNPKRSSKKRKISRNGGPEFNPQAISSELDDDFDREGSDDSSEANEQQDQGQYQDRNSGIGFTDTIMGATSVPETQHRNTMNPHLLNGTSLDTESNSSQLVNSRTAQAVISDVPAQVTMNGTRGAIQDNPSSTISPWARIQRLTSLSIPQHVLEHFQDADVDAETFLSERYELDDQLGADLARYTGKADLGSAFVVRFEYSMMLESRSQIDRARQCYVWLMWYDLVKLIRPDIKGTKLGGLVIEDVNTLLHAAYKGDREQIHLVFQHLSDWCKYGQRLNHLCELFGDGVILILSSELSLNFIKNLFTSSGKYHDDAIQHLRKLGLTTLASQPQVLKLGQNVRSFLIDVFAKHIPSLIHNIQQDEG